MLQQIDTIVRYLFKKNELNEVPVEELQQFVKEYPYSSAGRFLLSWKLREMQSEEFEEEIATASLYFNNPLWLQWALNGDETIAVPAETETKENLESEKEQEAVAPVIQLEQPDKTAAENQEAISPVVTQTESEYSEVHEPATNGTQEIKSENVNPELQESSASEFVFEPYHTIDYFASQGIKLKPEDLEKDKFGKQLRSFTDWLRSMKRIAPSKIDTALDESTENSIQKQAVHSVEGNEAETEAMAEVWIKQGNKFKAIDIYQKLSLLDPSKSHYFATKIEQLKD